MGFFISDNNREPGNVSFPNCSWIKGSGYSFYCVYSTDEVISKIIRLNHKYPDFGIPNKPYILPSLIVKFNTDIRLKKLFKKTKEFEGVSLFEDGYGHILYDSYRVKGLFSFVTRPMYLNRGMTQFTSTCPYTDLYPLIEIPPLKPKLKIRFTKSDKPGYVNVTVKEQPGIKEWEKIYD